jgi:hypothetical protein
VPAETTSHASTVAPARAGSSADGSRAGGDVTVGTEIGWASPSRSVRTEVGVREVFHSREQQRAQEGFG